MLYTYYIYYIYIYIYIYIYVYIYIYIYILYICSQKDRQCALLVTTNSPMSPW